MPTISGVLQEALDQILKKPVEKGYIRSYSLQGSSRTDRGVHAIGNAFHIEFQCKADFGLIPPPNLIVAFNTKLRKAKHLIRVTQMKEVASDVHARYSATHRKYIYKIYVGNPTVFLENYYWAIENINRERLEAAIQIFQNPINPTDLCKPDEKRPVNGPVEVDAWIEYKGNVIEIHYKSYRFFWHQVRFMTGAIVDYSLNNITQEEFESFFSGKTGKKPNIAPAEGLYLAEVGYS